MTCLLAHQGGWDEILMFVGPILLAFLVIRRLERRGKSRLDELEDQEESEVQNSAP